MLKPILACDIIQGTYLLLNDCINGIWYYSIFRGYGKFYDCDTTWNGDLGVGWKQIGVGERIGNELVFIVKPFSRWRRL